MSLNSSVNANNVLLSAHLDGELEPEEHIRVEKMLAEDPALREQFEGLRRASASLKLLERKAPPPELDLAQIHKLVRMDARRDVFERFEDHLPVLMSRHTSFLPIFALLAVVGLAIYQYSQWNFRNPPGDSAEIAGRTFFREGDVWFQEGLSLLLSTPRPVELDSREGRALLAQQPDLDRVAQLGEVVVDAKGDGLIRLIPGHTVDS